MVSPVNVIEVPVALPASVEPPLPCWKTLYLATGFEPGAEAGQDRVAVPVLLPEVLELRPETVGWPWRTRSGNPGAAAAWHVHVGQRVRSDGHRRCRTLAGRG